MATGCLSSPNTPKIAGLDDFQGPTYHTGNWPHEGVDFTGKRVGVIGTGSSAIQSIPIIAAAGQASHRVPAHRQLHRAGAQRAARSGLRRARSRPTIPRMRKRAKTKPAGIDFAINDGIGDRDARSRAPPRVRGALAPRRAGLPGAFTDLLLNDEANETAAEFVRAKIRESREGSRRSAELLSPTNIIGCKRLCVDTGYYETFNRPNVTLVDVSDEPIERITRDGRACQGPGLHVRRLVFATGFDAMTGALLQDRHPRPRRRDAAGQVERGAAAPISA